MEVKEWPIDKVKPYDKNPRNNDDAVEATANSIREFGWQQPIVVDKDGVIIVGHTRFKAAKKLKLEQVPVTVAESLTDEQVKAYRLADNKTGELADWDVDMLDDELNDILNIDMEDFGFEPEETNWQDKLTQNPIDTNLAQSFLFAPFSILNTRTKEWQDRKNQWKDIGIASELGRDGKLTYEGNITNGTSMSATSIFDPVLCELSYTWFMPDKGNKIIDPFAGGSVRGIVASKMNRQYTGIDLREEQINANIENANRIDINMPTWFANDSMNINDLVDNETQDLLFTCPPYADLEVYSDDKRDISNMSNDEFDKTYVEIIERSLKTLKPNRFAVVVIQDVRGNDGFYRDLQGLTINAMEKGGAKYYNDIILMNAVGTGAVRARKSMRYRKVVHLHQNVMVFFKGDPKTIKDNFNPLTDYFDALEDSSKTSAETIDM